MAARIGSGNVHGQIRQQYASMIRQDMGRCSAGILTWTMDSPRHADTSSGSVGGGRRDSWLVGWQAMEETAVASSYGSFPRGQTDQNVAHVLRGSYVVLFHVIGCT